MINLLPIEKIIAIISVIYAFIIATVVWCRFDVENTYFESISIAFVGGTIINLIILGIIHFGWKKIWKKYSSLNRVIFPNLNGIWKMEYGI